EKKSYPKDSIVQMIADAPPDFWPGAHYSYSNSNYYLIGIIAEQVSALPYDSLLQNRVLLPANLLTTGIDHEGLVLSNRATAYVWDNAGPAGADYLNIESPFAAGGMYSTAEDLLKWSAFFQKQIAKNKALKNLL